MQATAIRSQVPLAALTQSYVARRALLLCSYGALACLLGVLALVAAATVPVLFGYHNYTVGGDSMEPALKHGSVALAAPTSPRALRVGDIIAYRQSPENPPVLHRIVQIVTNEDGQPGFITQGDQNPTPDTQPVALQGPGDKVMYTVPYAGYVLDFASSTAGRILLIGVPLPVLLVMFLSSGKRTATPAREARPATETPEPQERPWTPRFVEQRPSFEEQAVARGLASARTRPVARGGAERTSLEAQAYQRGLLRPADAPFHADAPSQSRAA